MSEDEFRQRLKQMAENEARYFAAREAGEEAAGSGNGRTSVFAAWLVGAAVGIGARTSQQFHMHSVSGGPHHGLLMGLAASSILILVTLSALAILTLGRQPLFAHGVLAMWAGFGATLIAGLLGLSVMSAFPG